MPNNDPHPGSGDRIAALPVADMAEVSGSDFVVEEDGVYLLAGRSAVTGELVFPYTEIVSGGGTSDPVPVGPGGTLYSFSIIHVSATRDVPYAIGYVDFDNGLRVLAQVRGVDGETPCDTPVRLCADDEAWWVEPEKQGAGS